jgi:RHH-type proline utilization regulon transcriptional repressor/proline dehydrogenase/delta 1-pyrroline-5-carboxylate dehydrogenase
MTELRVGDPADPATDIGPVIDDEARSALARHAKRLTKEAEIIAQVPIPTGGTFFPPTLAVIPDAGFLDREVFGPILHVVRYDPARLSEAATPMISKRYGLTLGVHSRLERFVASVRDAVPAGNFYVNRSMVGAVVGVQPFGGVGLSGTGPKAGGPYSLLRYAVERTSTINNAAQGGDPSLFNLSA